MKSNMKFKGFTIIELMVSIFVTIIALSAFFKMYTNSVKADRSISMRTSVAHIGDEIAEAISGPIRLLGLNNTYGDWNGDAVITSANGGTGIDVVNFRFFSPYGGPITKLREDPAGNAPCSLKVYGSASIDSSVNTLQLIANDGIYTVTGASFYAPERRFDTGDFFDQSGASYTGDCPSKFPKGTLVTGRNNDYILSYINGGANTIISLTNATTGQSVFNFNNNANTAFSVPFFVLQFQREFKDAGDNIIRTWVTNPATIGDIKAIRFGFVMVSNRNRVDKKEASAGLSTTIDYCPFEGMCYSHNDVNKTAYVFRRVIHIKNFDYFEQNSQL